MNPDWRDWYNWRSYCKKNEFNKIGKSARYIQICNPRYALHKLRQDPFNLRNYYNVARDTGQLIYMNGKRELFSK